MSEQWVMFIQSAALLVLGGGLSWLAQWSVPRVRKARETADAAKSQAEAAKASAETYKIYRDELDKTFRNMSELRGRVETLEVESDSQQDALRDLRSRQDQYEAHIDDLYASIRIETVEISERIFGRLRTRRPARNGEGKGWQE
jgi:chromosome segregation ATPase